MSVERIRSMMSAKGIDACLIADNANLYYLSRRVFRGYIYIASEGDPIFFVMRPTGLSGNQWHYIRKPENIVAELEKLGLPKPESLGLELDDITYSQAMRLKAVFPDAEVGNISSLMREVRMVKSAEEVELMRFDGVKQAACYAMIPKLFKPGMTDVELQIEIEHVLRREGILGFLRTSGNLMEINMGSVLNGANADVPCPYDFAVGGGGVNGSLPVGADGRVMKEGTTVMVDMNGNFNGYQTDLTRTFVVGSAPQIAYDMHAVSIEICHALEKIALPGVPVKKLVETAMEIVEKHGLGEYFMGHTQQVSFIGHGVGIQLNEWPVLTSKSPHLLEENMTIAIEPKFVIPEVGAVGIENTYLVTANGLENLTVSPEELTVLNL